MACRPGHAGLVEEVIKASGSEQVELLEVDLADMESVNRFCDELRLRGEQIDIAVLNAGLIPRRARKSRQGFELMFAVHFLANRLLVERLLADGVISPSSDNKDRTRLVFVSSETHRSSGPVNFAEFGRFTPYGIQDSLRHYGHSKLILTTYASELSRRLGTQPRQGFAVHALCPGPVATRLAREAPGILKPLVSAAMKLLFLSPKKAAAFVIHLCCSSDAGERTGIYLHMMREQPVSPLASDERNGARLMAASDPILAPYISALPSSVR